MIAKVIDQFDENQAWNENLRILDPGTVPGKLPGQAMALVPPLAERLGEEWGKSIRTPDDRRTRADRWVAECLLCGHQSLRDSIDVNPDIHGGVPVIRGTRFTVAQALAELAETQGPAEFSDDFDLDVEAIKQLLTALSLMFQRPCER